MRIAVNAIFMQNNPLEGFGNFANQIVEHLIQLYPEHQFLLVYDRPFDSKHLSAPNVQSIMTGPPARHPLAFLTWYNWSLPRAIRAFKPDILLQPYGFSSAGTKVPQLLTLHDIAFVKYPEFVPKKQRLFYKFFNKKFVQRAARLNTVSDFSRKEIAEHYRISEDKIDIIPNGIKPIFQPLSWEEKEQVKQQYTEGTEFFLCTGTLQPRKNLLTLLKAFSIFKKRQRSSMKLVIAGRKGWGMEEFEEKLASFKFRKDVILTGYLADEALAKLTGAAYAMVYPSFYEGCGVPVLEAMQAGVPVITSSNSAMSSICKTAAVYASPVVPDEWAMHMNFLYSNESYRSQLIEKGKELVLPYTWEHTAKAYMDSIMKTLGA